MGSPGISLSFLLDARDARYSPTTNTQMQPVKLSIFFIFAPTTFVLPKRSGLNMHKHLMVHMTNQKAVEIIYNILREGTPRRFLKSALNEAARKRNMRLPSIIPTGSALNVNNAFLASTAAPPGDESSNAFLTFVGPEKSGKKPRKKHHMNCKRSPKSCKKHHSYCFKRVCVNLSSNPFHCGFCGLVCTHGMRCCKGVCVDLRKDRNHCGKCQNSCLPGESCVFGMCGYG